MLASGDTVIVTRIDHLARSTFDLFAVIKRIVDSGAHFRSLAEPWADTSTSTGRLMIAVLGGLADVERDLIRTRSVEGRAARESERRQVWPQVQAHCGPTQGGPRTPRGRPSVNRYRPVLQGQPRDDFAAQAVSVTMTTIQESSTGLL